MIILVTLICVLLALAIFAGAFYLAKHVISLQHRVSILEDSYSTATKHIEEQERHIIGLTQELEFVMRDKEQANVRPQRAGWNPANPMSVSDRHERQ